MKKQKSLLLTLAVVLTAAVCSVAVLSQDAYAASATPISTVEEFLAMENNPSGSYYLKNDITLPANTMIYTDRNNKFKGTFDGKGHTIKKYTYTDTTEYAMAGVFGYAWGATFKNVKLTNVDINVAGSSYVKAGALVADSYECTLTNIKVTGRIKASVSNCDSSLQVGGVTGTAVNKAITKCSSDVDITAKFAPGPYNAGDVSVGGIAGGTALVKVKDCSNSGNVLYSGIGGSDVNVSGLFAGGVKSASGCKNTGTVTAKTEEVNDNSASNVTVSGVCGGVDGGSVISCSNAGTIKVTGDYAGGYAVAGVVASPEAAKISKCWNKGAVSLNSKVGYDQAKVGGVFGYLNGGSVNLSYNKGKVSAVAKEGVVNAGGLGGEVYAGVKNCYNVAAVSLSGEGNVGGVLGGASLVGKTVTCVYNTGSVIGKNKANKGGILGTYSGEYKRNVKNNYYKGSGKAYGVSEITWKDWVAKANKVSSITSGNCPKLSSKVWTYSSKYKRLILKANKEK